MKKILAISVVLLTLTSTIFAAPAKFGASINYFAGYNYGALNYAAENFDASLGLASVSDDNALKTEYLDMILDITLKNNLDNNSAFIYGLLLTLTSGKINDTNLATYQSYGFYVGIQQKLTNNVLLNFKYFPISINNIKASGGTNTQTTYLGENIGFGLTYLF